MGTFKAVRIEKADKGTTVALAQFDEAELMDGDVTVRVEWSTVNYKDGLAVTGTAPVDQFPATLQSFGPEDVTLVEKLPMVPPPPLTADVKVKGLPAVFDVAVIVALLTLHVTSLNSG